MNWLWDATHPKAEERCSGVVEIWCQGPVAPGSGMDSRRPFMGHMISSWQYLYSGCWMTRIKMRQIIIPGPKTFNPNIDKCGKLEDLPSHCVVVEPFSTGAHQRPEWNGIIAN
ncbi:hypothetical protein M758_7G097700 [Ceratodon purpureus]|nr:hypothetical protein M758_7G097700 [Ceratodon purpureus]